MVPAWLLPPPTDSVTVRGYRETGKTAVDTGATGVSLRPLSPSLFGGSRLLRWSSLLDRRRLLRRRLLRRRLLGWGGLLRHPLRRLFDGSVGPETSLRQQLSGPLERDVFDRVALAERGVRRPVGHVRTEPAFLHDYGLAGVGIGSQ